MITSGTRLIVPVLLLFALPALATPLQDAATAYVEDARRAPSVAIALITPEGVEVAVAGKGDVSADSYFEIGSITKVFTGLLLAEMVTRGTVTLDATVGELIPDGRTLDPAVASITLRELSTHTSGLPRLPMGSGILWRLVSRPSDPYAGYTNNELFDELAKISATQLATRGSSSYSNFGVALLGRLLESAGGAPYEQLLKDRVLLPMGLEKMAFTSEMMGDPALMRPHRANGIPTGHWRLDAYSPAGGLTGSLNHLVRFLQIAMAPGAGSPMALSIEEGLGWARSERDGEVMIWHNGQTGGFHSFVGFVVGTGRGVVMLSNAASSSDRVAISILRGDPQISRQEHSWTSIGFTLLFSWLGPLILISVLRAPVSRLHVADAIVSTGFLLALTWKLGAWTDIPLLLWYAAAVVSILVVVAVVPRLASAPWIRAGKPWTTAGKLLSLIVMGFGWWWAVVRL